MGDAVHVHELLLYERVCSVQRKRRRKKKEERRKKEERKRQNCYSPTQSGFELSRTADDRTGTCGGSSGDGGGQAGHQ